MLVKIRLGFSDNPTTRKNPAFIALINRARSTSPRVWKYFPRAQVVQIDPGDFTAPRVCWRGGGVVAGRAGQRRRRYHLGAGFGRGGLLAGDLLAAAQTDAGL